MLYVRIPLLLKLFRHKLPFWLLYRILVTLRLLSPRLQHPWPWPSLQETTFTMLHAGQHMCCRSHCRQGLLLSSMTFSCLCLQMPGTSARSHAAEQRQRLYQLASQQLGRDVSSTCSICCEPIDPLQPTSGEEQQLLVLACLHCFHFKCWETWKEKQSTCPSCKQPMPLGQQH